MLDWWRKLRAGNGVERKLLAWHALGRPVWSARDPAVFAREGYARNAIAYRCVRMIAEAAASAPLVVGPVDHPLARLLARPNPEQTGVELLEAFYGHLQVSGNTYMEAASIDDDAPSELYVLRPDRMSVVPGADGWPVGWEHRVGAVVRRFERDPVTNDAPILHLKLFHPADARPHPAFPARTEVWMDGGSWRLGHWLNGRAGLSVLGEVVSDICARASVDDVDVASLVGAVAGYVVDSPADARAALEPLMTAYDFVGAEREGRLGFFHCDDQGPVAVALADLSAASVGSACARRGDAAEAPIEARVRFIDPARDYLIAAVSARGLDSAEGGVVTIDAPLALEVETASAIARSLLADRRAAVETLSLELGPAHLALEPGDRVLLEGRADMFDIVRIEDAEVRRVELIRARAVAAAHVNIGEPNAPATPQIAPSPALSVLDIPALPNAESETRPLVALFAAPWFGPHDLYAGAGLTRRARADNPAIMGELLWALWPGPVDRWDDGNIIRVKFYGGLLASATADAVLDGANIFAIESDSGEWELVQARRCELVGANEYELSGFLRGQLGSSHAMRSPHPVGARIVKLDSRLVRADIAAHEWGEALSVSAPPAGALANDPRATSATLTLPHAATRLWAPAHLRARRQASGDVAISWIRCARSGGDGWSSGEPPIGAPEERYLLEILDGGGDVVRGLTVTSPTYLYGSAEQSADFGAPPALLRVRVAQIGENGAAGLNKELTITL